MENFIFEQYLDDVSICDELIAHHKSAETFPGVVGSGVDKTVKDSTDCLLYNGDLHNRYMAQVQKIVNQYIEKFPACNLYAPWGLISPLYIQHYAPGQGFKAWHTERSNPEQYVATRHLVFMTYLNDVTDKGGTEFMNQKLTVDARKGKTLIWPTDWTYTHRGVVSPTQEKYIVTSWLSYI